jgi:hypothetical protein
VYERRQRSWLADAGAAVSTGVVAFGILAAGACTPVSPTASSSGPTATPLPAVQNPLSGAAAAVSGAQTVLPAAQGTLQAAATAVSPQVQYVTQVLSSILGGGVQLQIEQEPPEAANAQVTHLRLRATDASGAFAKLDRDGRDKTAQAVVLTASQFYPQATVDLLVVDGANKPVLTASRNPGEPPQVDD